MSRSKYKNFSLNILVLKSYLNKKQNKKFDLKIKNKNVIILPLFVNMIWKVYNGKQYIKLKIIKEMIGYKLGEFILTRKVKHAKK